MRDDFEVYLTEKVKDRTFRLEQTSKAVSSNHAIIVAMKCELNMLKEVLGRYQLFSGSMAPVQDTIETTQEIS